MSRRQIHPVAAEPLSTLLAEKAREHAFFTVCELRDQLIELEALADFDQKSLRLYVRDQINQRVKRGEVERVGLHPRFKQRDQFRVADAFGAGDKHLCLDGAQATSDVEPLAVKLSRDSEQLREQMEDSGYRLQAFQEIAEKYPEERDEIAPLFEQEKAQARALGEKLKAYATVQQWLAKSGGDA